MKPYHISLSRAKKERLRLVGIIRDMWSEENKIKIKTTIPDSRIIFLTPRNGSACQKLLMFIVRTTLAPEKRCDFKVIHGFFTYDKKIGWILQTFKWASCFEIAGVNRFYGFWISSVFTLDWTTKRVQKPNPRESAISQRNEESLFPRPRKVLIPHVYVCECERTFF